MDYRVKDMSKFENIVEEILDEIRAICSRMLYIGALQQYCDKLVILESVTKRRDYVLKSK